MGNQAPAPLSVAAMATAGVALLVPYIGLMLGIAGIVLAAVAKTKHERLATPALVLSIAVVILILVFPWVFAGQMASF